MRCHFADYFSSHRCPSHLLLLRVTHSKVLSARDVGVFKYEELCSYQVTSWNERTLQSMLAYEGVAFAVAFVRGVRLQGMKEVIQSGRGKAKKTSLYWYACL